MLTLPDFLTKDDLGMITLASHRIGLEDVVYYFNQGFSPEMLVGQFPTLPLGLVYQVIGFYLAHRAEVDQYIHDHETSIQKQRAAGKHVDLALLRERLGSLHLTELTAEKV